MNTSLLSAGLCASVLAPAFTCSALLARLTAQDRTPLDDRPRLWRRTGPSP